jgi:high-affinity Fe2+/Pb2+ permease
MVRDPYAPPRAPVADIKVVPTAPRDVRTACDFYWASFAVSMLVQLIEGMRQPSAPLVIGALIGTAIGGLIGGVITWWFVSKLKAGRNWMRLLLTIAAMVICLSVPVFWPFYRDVLSPSLMGTRLRIIEAAVQIVLGLWSLFLINSTKSREWFLSMKRASESAA